MKGADKKISIIFLKAHIHSLVCVSSTVATQSPLGGDDFPAVWNYGKLSAKFLVSRIKDIDTVGVLSFFSSFTQRTIKLPLKFPAFTFNKPKGWSMSASNTEANSATFNSGEGKGVVDGVGGSSERCWKWGGGGWRDH